MRCKCRRKHKCPLDGKCDETAGTCSLDGKYRAQNIVYKCTVSADEYPSKVYLGTAEGDFKQNLYNHRMSFDSKGYSANTTLSKYVWEMKKVKITPSLKWYIVKSVPACLNISKIC